MTKKETAIIIDGKKYVYRSTGTCEACALREKCKNVELDVLCKSPESAQDSIGNFQFVGDENALTEEKVYDFYQERSGTAGKRADHLAWMFVVMMTGGLISGHAFQTFSVCAALSATYAFFSIMQAVWQMFSSWLFLQRIEQADVIPDDYPSWVGGGAWMFFGLKMISISAAVIYFVYAIFSQ